jgi:thiol:disulfide interchange protein
MDNTLSQIKRIPALLLLIFFSLIPLLTSPTFADNDSSERSLFPSVEDAFILKARLIQENQVELSIKLAPHCLLYRDRLKLKTLEGKTISLHQDSLPPAMIKKDDFLNETHFVYSKELTFRLSLPQSKGLRIEYQGCVEDGFCYNAVAKEIFFSRKGVPIITDLSPDEFNQETLSESDRITSNLKSNNLFLTFLIFLGMGIFLAFTPCVLPMIPILANILMGEEKMPSARRAFFLTSLYVLSVAVCYAIAGACAGMMGNHFQAALQKPFFLTILSFLLLLFALSQFDFIHLQFPQIFKDTLHRLQRKQKAGSLIGAIGMGAISAFMVSPCVTPALIGALSYIGQTGNALLGGVALFALAFGMGLPLLLAATVGSHLLPKTGRWMRKLKTLTGILLIILSYSLLDRAFPSQTVPAVFNTITTITINNEDAFNRALEEARLAKKPLIIEAYADWCLVCRQMDQDIFNNEQLLSTLETVRLLRLDITQQTPDIIHLQKRLKIMGPPTILFFDDSGSELKNLRLIGKINLADFLKQVDKIVHLRQNPLN